MMKGNHSSTTTTNTPPPKRNKNITSSPGHRRKDSIGRVSIGGIGNIGFDGSLLLSGGGVGGVETFNPSKSHTTTTNNNDTGMVLKSMRYWDVRMPPVKKHMVQGYLVPTVKGSQLVGKAFTSNKKPRRISIEIHETSQRAAAKRLLEEAAGGIAAVGGASSSNFNVVSSLQQQNKRISGGGFGYGSRQKGGVEIASFLDEPLDENDVIVIRILKPKRKGSNLKSPQSQSTVAAVAAAAKRDNNNNTTGGGDCDEQSVLSLSTVGFDDGFQMNQTGIEWVESMRSLLMGVELVSGIERISNGSSGGFGSMLKGSISPHNATTTTDSSMTSSSINTSSSFLYSIDVQFGAGNDTRVQAIYFSTHQQAQSFVHTIQQMRGLFRTRARQMAEDYMVRSQQNSTSTSPTGGGGTSAQTTPTRTNTKQQGITTPPTTTRSPTSIHPPPPAGKYSSSSSSPPPPPPPPPPLPSLTQTKAGVLVQPRKLEFYDAVQETRSLSTSTLVTSNITPTPTRTTDNKHCTTTIDPGYLGLGLFPSWGGEESQDEKGVGEIDKDNSYVDEDEEEYEAFDTILDVSPSSTKKEKEVDDSHDNGYHHDDDSNSKYDDDDMFEDAHLMDVSSTPSPSEKGGRFSRKKNGGHRWGFGVADKIHQKLTPRIWSRSGKHKKRHSDGSRVDEENNNGAKNKRIGGGDGGGQDGFDVEGGASDFLSSYPMTTACHGQEEEDDTSIPVDLLVEIVSATNLPVADVFSSDPYVIVRDGLKELHRTSVLSNTLNPIWTLETGSLFLIRTTAMDFFARAQFLTFVIEDYDSVSANDYIGSVEVEKHYILNDGGNGERVEFDVNTFEPMRKNSRGMFLPVSRAEHKNQVSNEIQGVRDAHKRDAGKATLSLRFKHATPAEIEFLESYKANKKWHKHGIFSEESNIPSVLHKAKMVQKMKRQGPNGVQYRTKPMPDPNRDEQETKWLTKYELGREAKKPSMQWIETGSGSLGKVYFELIGCDNLPNLDSSVTGRDKTDAFACIVFEDAIAHTEVINDTLSPWWMPWTQRAFVFSMMHPSSQLRVGVFDYDEGNRAVGNQHDKIGKVNIDITNFSPGTVYTMTYPILQRSIGHHVVNGTITVRLRVELKSQRDALIAAIRPVHPCYVSVPDKKDFEVTRYTIDGKTHKRLMVQQILGYIEELQSYEEVLHYLELAAITVLLWRGHYAANFRVLSLSHSDDDESSDDSEETSPGFLERWTKPVTVLLPLHSMTAFAWGIFVAQDLNRLPAFLAFAIGWGFLATMEYVRNHPSPWHRCRSYTDLLGVLLFNHSFSPESIAVNKNLRAVEAYKEMEKARRKQRALEKEQREKLEADIRKTEEELEEEALDGLDITSKANNVVQYLNPFKHLLRPAAVELKKIVMALRVAKSIILWRDSYTAFFVVTASFLSTLVLVWIPWSFLIIWTCRICAWVFLGPWMKLVDIFYIRKHSYETAEEMTRAFEEALKDRYQAVLEKTLEQQVNRERAFKLQELQKYMFGKYIMRVPIYKEELVWDDPLPSSMARPYDYSKEEPIHIAQRKWGQRLSGDMIPTREKNMARTGDSLSNETTGAETDLLLPTGNGGYGACAS